LAVVELDVDLVLVERLALGRRRDLIAARQRRATDDLLRHRLENRLELLLAEIAFDATGGLDQVLVDAPLLRRQTAASRHVHARLKRILRRDDSVKDELGQVR